MIYTVGKVNIYEPYISNDPCPQKAGRCENNQGGSVWETFKLAQDYLDEFDTLKEFRVYGVLADWDTQTEEVVGKKWRDLLINADLVRIM